jgi:hypothetical protein
MHVNQRKRGSRLSSLFYFQFYWNNDLHFLIFIRTQYYVIFIYKALEWLLQPGNTGSSLPSSLLRGISFIATITYGDNIRFGVR